MLSGLENQVFDYIESNRDPMLKFLQKMVRIDTQTPPGLNYDTLCELLAEKYHALGYETGIHVATEKISQVIRCVAYGFGGPEEQHGCEAQGV